MNSSPEAGHVTGQALTPFSKWLQTLGVSSAEKAKGRSAYEKAVQIRLAAHNQSHMVDHYDAQHLWVDQTKKITKRSAGTAFQDTLGSDILAHEKGKNKSSTLTGSSLGAALYSGKNIDYFKSTYGKEWLPHIKNVHGIIKRALDKYNKGFHPILSEEELTENLKEFVWEDIFETFHVHVDSTVRKDIEFIISAENFSKRLKMTHDRLTETGDSASLYKHPLPGTPLKSLGLSTKEAAPAPGAAPDIHSLEEFGFLSAPTGGMRPRPHPLTRRPCNCQRLDRLPKRLPRRPQRRQNRR
jgi:hypothetical protein